MMEGLKQEFIRSAALISVTWAVGLANIGTFGEGSPNDWCPLPPNTILVAKELLPSDMLQLDRTNLVAWSRSARPASHVAIMGADQKHSGGQRYQRCYFAVGTGDRLLVDAEADTVTVAPTKVQVARFVARRSQYASLEPTAAPGPAQNSATKDVYASELYANIAERMRRTLSWSISWTVWACSGPSFSF